jgi:nucleoid DNA-binding protein
MNKAEFIDMLSKELDTSKAVAGKNLDALLKCVTHAMKINDELRFTGFGTFKGKHTKAKEVRTPKGTMARVPAQRRISFSVGKEFKNVVNS